MARLLLMDADTNHAALVALALERAGHKLTVTTHKAEVRARLSTHAFSFNAIILDFANRSEDWEILDEVRRMIATLTPKPGILCVARTNSGADVKLRAEQKGVRLSDDILGAITLTLSDLTQRELPRRHVEHFGRVRTGGSNPHLRTDLEPRPAIPERLGGSRRASLGSRVPTEHILGHNPLDGMWVPRKTHRTLKGIRSLTQKSIRKEAIDSR